MSGEGSNRAPDFEPPMASVSRVVRAALPENIFLTKDAKTALARASGIFVFYLTHAANEISRDSKRQTILTSDVTRALKELGYEDFEQPLEQFLDLYRKEANENKKSSKKASDKEGENKEGGGDMDVSTQQADGDEMDEGEA